MNTLKKRIGQLEVVSDWSNDYQEDAEINADWLLREVESLYKQCRKQGNHTQAVRCLDIIGKHVDVKAFEKRVAVSDEFTLAELVAKTLSE